MGVRGVAFKIAAKQALTAEPKTATEIAKRAEMTPAQARRALKKLVDDPHSGVFLVGMKFTNSLAHAVIDKHYRERAT